MKALQRAHDAKRRSESEYVHNNTKVLTWTILSNMMKDSMVTLHVISS